ncbi:glycosyltransferase family 4 protein [Mucilaginibacter sp.]|uniref:glycosyltransferase family 4 protein n=1 Tax=Mucilaginibacter sp. TaxID=1882438 RepID=UPI003D0F9B04
MPPKYSLCVDARMYNHSGIGKYLQMLLPYLCKAYDTTLLGDAETLSSLSSIAQVIPFNSPIYSIDEQRKYKKAAKPADLFWSPHYNVPLMWVKSKRRIATIHDVYHLAFYKELSFKQKLYAKVVINAAVKLSDEVITVSGFSKGEIIKYTGCATQKVNVVYNGVSQAASYNNTQNVRDKYSLPANYILFVGNVKPHKNLKTLLKAYLLLSSELKQQYKVVIVGKRDGFLTGDEELTHWIKSQPEVQQAILFTGYVANEDMDTIYKNASLFVFPSVYEGFGLPPLEAMLNSCPVIAAATSSLPEVCGDAALYFNPRNEIELTNKMTEVLTQKSVSDGLLTNGLQRIKQFTWDDCAAKHIEIFNRVIKSV